MQFPYCDDKLQSSRPANFIEIFNRFLLLAAHKKRYPDRSQVALYSLYPHIISYLTHMICMYVYHLRDFLQNCWAHYTKSAQLKPLYVWLGFIQSTPPQQRKAYGRGGSKGVVCSITNRWWPTITVKQASLGSRTEYSLYFRWDLLKFPVFPFPCCSCSLYYYFSIIIPCRLR